MSLKQAKDSLDKIIKKARIHLYKPIQIAEILHQQRRNPDMDLTDLEQYRTSSRKWRDEVSSKLVGRISTSSSRYQDDVFNDNAMPPRLLAVLGKENLENAGVVEAYIYDSFLKKHIQLAEIIKFVNEATPQTFKLDTLLGMFWNQPGLKRSIDKVYEIVVYALFNTLVDVLGVQVTLSVDRTKDYLIKEFEDFTKIVLGISTEELELTTPARLYRVGVTNAADRGLDMWANFGPAIQVKHLTLNEELAIYIADEVEADRIIIVCQDCDQKVINYMVRKMGWTRRVQGIVTESQLLEWYGRALTGKYSDELADRILQALRDELHNEFPSDANSLAVKFYTDRGYHKIERKGIWEKEISVE